MIIETSLLNRHRNNKANSMESLSLLLAELGHRPIIWIMAWLCIQLSYDGRILRFPPSPLPKEDLPMETFTLSKEIVNLQLLESSDKVRHTFTMEAYTLWSYNLMVRSTTMDSPSPQGRQHLSMEAFTLDSHIFVFSNFIFSPVGISAPCTYSVYKAAHRKIHLCEK